jgi:hypothetical protein
MGLSHICKSLNVGIAVIETWGEYESLVGVFSAVVEDKLVLIWVECLDSTVGVYSIEWLDLS